MTMVVVINHPERGRSRSRWF